MSQMQITSDSNLCLQASPTAISRHTHGSHIQILRQLLRHPRLVGEDEFFWNCCTDCLLFCSGTWKATPQNNLSSKSMKLSHEANLFVSFFLLPSFFFLSSHLFPFFLLPLCKWVIDRYADCQVTRAVAPQFKWSSPEGDRDEWMTRALTISCVRIVIYVSNMQI